MPVETIVPLSLFAAIMVGTPGPANLLIMTAGARWGVAACMPFIGGVIVGKLALNVALAFGALSLLAAHPQVEFAMRIASAAYMLALAWGIAFMRLGDGAGGGKAARPRFFAGIIVHPLNPKAWAMLTAAYAQFTTPAAPWAAQVAVVCAVFFFAQWAAHPFWCWLGASLRARVEGGKSERVVMAALALLTVAIAFWALLAR